VSRPADATTPLSRALREWTAPGQAHPALEKLRSKLARNLELDWSDFVRKGLAFAWRVAASRARLRGVSRLGVGVHIHGHTPSIDNQGGTLTLGDDVVFSAPVTAIHLVVSPGALLSIGDEAWINDGVWVGCTQRIVIGLRALIGPGVRLFDNDYHELYQRRRLPVPRPIVVEDDVWIATGAVILPGVTLGRGSVVGANAVVHHDVAPFTVVAGAPARVVKTLDPAQFVQG
jgi:acetyltransferase-like isoleucine patch superfamily enzyme